MSEWKVKKTFTVNSVGYSPRVLAKYKTERTNFPHWVDSLPPVLNTPTNRIINEFLREEFCRRVRDGSEWQYKITAALAQFLIYGIGNHEFSQSKGCHGIVYPTLASFANSENLALLPECATEFLEPLRSELYRVEEVFRNGHYRVTLVDSAPGHDSNGQLLWSGRPLHLGVLPASSRAALDEDGRWKTNNAFTY